MSRVSPRPGERWAGVAACSRSDRWGNNLDARDTKRAGGPTVEALRKEVGARLQRSAMGPFLFFFFFF